VFSGATVAISLAALLIFPQVFMRSFAYAGIAVVGVALLGSVVVLPALLMALGRRIDSLRVRRTRPAAAGEGRWHRIATAVMRRPVPIATAVVALLVVLGLPFLRVEFGQADDRVLPAGNSARAVSEELRTGFAGNEAGAATVVARGDGNLSGPLGFTATGTLDTSMPILMFCMAFGLSMDYEVFLLSRIKEEHDRTGDNTAAVAMGLERTGRIVTAAAALLAIVFIAFATSGVTFIKLVGIGLALAIVMDATLVRAALVPAFMRLAGRANWWAPPPLRRLYERVGISEGEPPTDAAPVGGPV